MQYAWYHAQISKLNTSLLFLNTGYEYVHPNAQLDVDYKQTFGTYITFKEKKRGDVLAGPPPRALPSLDVFFKDNDVFVRASHKEEQAV